MFGQADDLSFNGDLDLADVQAAGELIAVTLSGPETYYEYRGEGFGLQYNMAQSFANTIGARLRMEMSTDTSDLFQRLRSGEAELIALEFDSLAVIPDDMHRMANGWVVRSSSSEIAAAVEQWWHPELRDRLLAASTARVSSPLTNHRRRPAILSRETGRISKYDDLFIKAAQRVGWDWRLLASQCYQESGFDPQAVSWAGACGLMQIMPSTGERLGVSRNELFDAARNVEAASRYLVQLSSCFSDISNSHERIFFVLAAYNGGAGHIRDAMALAKADGRSVQLWSEVEPYVLALASSATCRNPLVKYGYLRGDETVDYVRQIRQRWNQYRGIAHPHSVVKRSHPSESRPSRVRPRSSFILNDSL